jgi:DNA-binding LytR/AlgR family response regulator
MNTTSRFRDYNILVVEDEYFIAMELAWMIERWGATALGPLTAESQAFTFIGREGAHIHGAILDIHLGSQLVYSVADKLRELDVPIVFVTGYGASTIPESYRNVPRCEKPFDQEQLAQALERSFGGG